MYFFELGSRHFTAKHIELLDQRLIEMVLEFPSEFLFPHWTRYKESKETLSGYAPGIHSSIHGTKYQKRKKEHFSVTLTFDTDAKKERNDCI